MAPIGLIEYEQHSINYMHHLNVEQGQSGSKQLRLTIDEMGYPGSDSSHLERRQSIVRPFHIYAGIDLLCYFAT